MSDALTRERVREALTDAAISLVLHYGDESAAVVRALADALDDPARWCAIVGDVATVEHDTLRLVHRGEIVVTPHKEGA